MAFIDEKAAAAKVNYAPRTLRIKVLSGALKIAYNSRDGRHYRYNDADLNKLLNDPGAVITGVPDYWQQRRQQKQSA